MKIALGIILVISIIALVYLFIVVVRGGNKNSQSFQRELALRKAKKDSKQLAKDYVEGKVTYAELEEKIYNKETLRRVKVNEEKAAAAKEALEQANIEFKVVCANISNLETSLQKYKTSNNVNKVKEIAKDVTVDQNTGNAYYVVKVECKNMEIKNKDGEKGNLKSGMAAQAKIVVDDDSVLHFVLSKINLVD